MHAMSNATFWLSKPNGQNRVNYVCGKLFGKSRVEFCH